MGPGTPLLRPPLDPSQVFPPRSLPHQLPTWPLRWDQVQAAAASPGPCDLQPRRSPQAKPPGWHGSPLSLVGAQALCERSLPFVQHLRCPGTALGVLHLTPQVSAQTPVLQLSSEGVEACPRLQRGSASSPAPRGHSHGGLWVTTVPWAPLASGSQDLWDQLLMLNPAI